MALTGTKPIPTKLHILRGNPSNNKQRIDMSKEPQPKIRKRVPKPPIALKRCGDMVAHKEWRKIAKKLFRLGLLADVDESALMAYCVKFSKWWEAEQHVYEHGHVLINRYGDVVKNPSVEIANKNLNLMHKYLVEFGLTPSSRCRIKYDPPKSKSEDVKFFGG
jgi:P27 family predicted phage terminase small subunit